MEPTSTANKKRKNPRSQQPTKQKKGTAAEKAQKQQPSQQQQPRNRKRKGSSKEDNKQQPSMASSALLPKVAKKSIVHSSPNDASTKSSNGALSASASATAGGVALDSPHGCFNYMGVTFHPHLSKYEARTRRGSHEFPLGLFVLACDAALAYDVAHRITGGGGGDGRQPQPTGLIITNDVEEIKYALNWLDQAPEHANPAAARGENEAGVNFTTPSIYREARRKEIGSYLTGSIPHPTFNLENVPQEEELKMRIKKEILNLAKAYVIATQQGMKKEEGSGDATTTSLTMSDTNQTISGENKKKAVSSLLKKKTWVPEESRESSRPGYAAAAASRKEEAEALLALQKKRHTETKKEALAQKLEKLMSGKGGGGGATTSSPPSLSCPPKNNAQSKKVGSSGPVESLAKAAKAAAAKGADKKAAKIIPEETKSSKVSNNNNPSSVVKNESLPQQSLKQQKHKAALDNWKIAAAGYCSSLLPDSTISGNNGQPSSSNNSKDFPKDINNEQEWVPLAAHHHPDVLNKNAVRHNTQQQQNQNEQAMEAAAIMKAAKIHASLLGGGSGGAGDVNVDGRQLHSSPLGLQPPAGNASSRHPPNKAEVKKQPEVPLSSNSIHQQQQQGSKKLEESTNDQGSVAKSVTDLLAGMGHKGPIPPGLMEHLQAAMKHQQQQQQHGGSSEQQGRMMEATHEHHGRGGEEDPQVTLQRQLINETKKAALAQKLSSIMAGNDNGGMMEAQMMKKNDGGIQEAKSNHLKTLQEQAAAAHAASSQEYKMLSAQKQAGQNHEMDGNKSKLLNPSKGASKKTKSDGGQNQKQQGNKRKGANVPTTATRASPMMGNINSQSRERQLPLEEERMGKMPEHIASLSAAAAFQQQPSLQALQALQGALPVAGLPEGMDEQAAIQSLLMKRQMQEMNKQALERKVQDYMQGRGVPQQQQQQAPGMDLTQSVALQSLLQDGGNAMQQSLLGHHPSDLARQNAVQTLLANQQGTNNQISEVLTHDVVHRRLVLESMLMSEENRLRQLREALQSELVSEPQQQQMHPMGGGLGGFAAGNHRAGQQAFHANALHELMLEREQQAMQDEIRRSILTAELNASIANQNSQEMALRQALALRSSQEADIPLERLLEAARNNGQLFQG